MLFIEISSNVKLTNKLVITPIRDPAILDNKSEKVEEKYFKVFIF